MDIERTRVKSISCLGEIDDYVYDISIDDQDPFFFGNDILLHNTDSSYFSAYSSLKKDIEQNLVTWNKKNIVSLYDIINDNVNASFVNFMQNQFHCPPTRGEVIKSGREIVASKGLFITKKRYAVLYFDKEGKRVDNDSGIGKIKAMGLDLKRSDTPVIAQNFLSKVLFQVLTGVEKEEILEYISNFRLEFNAMLSWHKGTPKRVNNITAYRLKEEKTGKSSMPGHVRASINWNTLKRINNDKYSMPIVDGSKVIVCKLKNNPLGYTSIAYPIDELRLPSWFTELPFDDEEMENTIIDNKLKNLIGVLHWDIASTNQKNTFNELFDFM